MSYNRNCPCCIVVLGDKTSVSNTTEYVLVFGKDPVPALVHGIVILHASILTYVVDVVASLGVNP